MDQIAKEFPWFDLLIHGSNTIALVFIAGVFLQKGRDLLKELSEIKENVEDLEIYLGLSPKSIPPARRKQGGRRNSIAPED